jgi:hypothetical protein
MSFSDKASEFNLQQIMPSQNTMNRWFFANAAPFLSVG